MKMVKVEHFTYECAPGAKFRQRPKQVHLVSASHDCHHHHVVEISHLVAASPFFFSIRLFLVSWLLHRDLLQPAEILTADIEVRMDQMCEHICP